MPIDSRRVLAADRPFLLDLYVSTRAGEFCALGWSPGVLRAFLEQQYRAREAGWADSTPDADDCVLVHDGRPIGRLVIDRRPDGIRIVDIAVVPGEQASGIGTSVLQRVLDEADAVGAPVTLHVVATNPARRLYDRLGFVPVTQDDIRVLMERSSREPAGPQPNTAT